VVREQLKKAEASELIARFRDSLTDAESLDTIRHLTRKPLPGIGRPGATFQ
jgi:hypothetical protein